MKRARSFTLLFLGLLLLIPPGCDDDDPVKVDDPTDDEVSPEAFTQRIAETNDLAFALYHHLSPTFDNLMISPHSIAVAFGSAYAGARGSTEEEMADALRFPYPQARLHSTLRALNDTLMSRGEGQDSSAFRLKIANSCWGDEHWHYERAYLDTLTRCYGAPIQYVDFMSQSEEARQEINQWVADQTENRVLELLPEGVLDSGTTLVLANTVYFRASWLMQFKPEYTRDKDFLRLDGSIVSVPIMGGMAPFPYYDGDGYRAVELPYVGEQVSMIAVMPDSGEFVAFESGFDADCFQTVLGQLEETFIDIDFPRFAFDTPLDLVQTLKDMDMTEAFAPGANFTGIDGTDDGEPWIDGVWHKTFISVDEYGTEAAAGTGIEVYCAIIPSFSGDRPFLFVIYDRPTGTILFLGRVLDPTSSGV